MDRQTDNLIGEASSFLEVIEQVSLIAAVTKPALVVGERGTGKELIAARIHFLSSRWDQPFVKLNCAAINENLLETELFGHESGAFTGASKRHLGRFEIAHRGTLFLDEIGNSSQAVQEKLLRVIEYGEMERVGGNKTIKIDVRIVAATNENLPQLAAEGKFRADLLDRLAFDVITIPPLRARIDDIPLLAEHFALSMTRELNRDYFAGFSRAAMQAMLEYEWPGNVRELKNVIERNIYRAGADQIIDAIEFDPFASPYNLVGERQSPSVLKTDKQSEETNSIASIQPPSSALSKPGEFPIDFKQKMTDTEIEWINLALEKAQFNQKKCAELLGLTYHQLRGYLKKYQLLDQK